MSALKILLLWLFCSLSLTLAAANTTTLVLDRIQSTTAGAPALTLPHFVSQPSFGLLQKEWFIELPEITRQFELPALFISQSIAGAELSINGITIYSLAGSDEYALRNNYTPAIIQIPKQLLSATGPTQLRLLQTGHLRGWFIPPLLVAELNQLQPLYNAYIYLGQTLSTTINIVCSFAGVFLLVIGINTREKTYIYCGCVTLVWAFLFSLALLSELPYEFFRYWRLALYLCIGYLIHFVCHFIAEVLDYRAHASYTKLRFITLNLGWIIYGLGGDQTEKFLDIYWVAVAVGIYIIQSALAIRNALKLKKYQFLIPLGLHWIFTSILAAHDYLLQAGLLQISTPTTTLDLIKHLAQQPIYLTHLALPAFVFMAFAILYTDHLDKIAQQKQQAQELLTQRERFVNDIHDGVGSRINLLLWQLKIKPPSSEQIENDLRHCMDELRFAINPQGSGHTTLANALQNLCARLQAQSQANGIHIDYSQTDNIQPLETNVALQLYKILQEAMANALRHSQASHIQLLVVQAEHTLTLTLKDNGRGIAHWSNMLQKQTNSQGASLGLRSMQDRVQQIPAMLHINSTSNGTILSVSFEPASYSSNN